MYVDICSVERATLLEKHSSLRPATEQCRPFSELLLSRFLLLLCFLPLLLLLFDLLLELAAFVGFFNLKVFKCNETYESKHPTLSSAQHSTYLGFKEVLSSANSDLVNIDLSEGGELPES